MDSPALSTNRAPANRASERPAAGPPSAPDAQPPADDEPIVAQIVSPAAPCAQKPAAHQGIVAGVVAAVVLLGLAALWLVDPARWDLPLCGLYRLTGLYCPGCGATRATHELLHGRMLVALQDNALWVLSLPLVFYAAASEIRRQCWDRPLPGDLTRKRWVLAAVVAVVLVFFVLRNLPWEPFVWLAP